jgi:hypothetical protein
MIQSSRWILKVYFPLPCVPYLCFMWSTGRQLYVLVRYYSDVSPIVYDVWIKFWSCDNTTQLNLYLSVLNQIEINLLVRKGANGFLTPKKRKHSLSIMFCCQIFCPCYLFIKTVLLIRKQDGCFLCAQHFFFVCLHAYWFCDCSPYNTLPLRSLVFCLNPLEE